MFHLIWYITTTPYQWRLYINLRCGIVSDAFAKSMEIKSLYVYIIVVYQLMYVLEKLTRSHKSGYVKIHSGGDGESHLFKGVS